MKNIRGVESKIENILEEAESLILESNILQDLEKNLKDKWEWKLTDDIKDKFQNRFKKIKKVNGKYEAWDTKKNRGVYLRPDTKSFVQVKDTGNQCGFLNGAVRAAKNAANKEK